MKPLEKTNKQSGSINLDPTKMSFTDLVEGAYMLQATGTLLRQAFGIISLTNSLQENPMSDSELKSFAQSFDLVHKTCNTFGVALRDYANKQKEKGN